MTKKYQHTFYDPGTGTVYFQWVPMGTLFFTIDVYGVFADYLDKEMKSVKSEYYVIKPDARLSIVVINRSTYNHVFQMTVDGNVSTNRTNDCDFDRQLPPPPLCTWESYNNSNSSSRPPRTVSRNRTKAMDIIDPETGKKVQL
ncbi:hypothetical protein ACI65C_012527 [Semiaphis heraclei]